MTSVSQTDLDAVAEQLQRTPRGIVEIASRCPSGHPNVVKTEPRLDDGTPFPTLYYLTCPRLAGEIGTLEASGLMKEMSARLLDDEALRHAYEKAHAEYLAEREELGHVEEIAGISAGGMPTRVKCLHVLVGHALAKGPGVNPLGDEALDLLGDWWTGTSCAADWAKPHESAVRVASIDCGTNSIRLLISDVTDGHAVDVIREMRIVRLGQDVDRTRRLADDAIVRTLDACREYAELIGLFGVEKLRFCATSAVRDATNAEQFADAVEQVLGVRPLVLAGEQEAQASFVGATRELAAVRTLVADIGGGSTELVIGTGEQIEWSVSFDVGSVRLTERFLPGDPPSVGEVSECIDYIDAVLAPVVERLQDVEAFVGVAGTVTTVAAHALELPSYDSQAIHLAQIPVAEMGAACISLAQMSVADRRHLPFMHSGRADVIGAGALILDRLVEALPSSVRCVQVSEHDILDGIAWELVNS